MYRHPLLPALGCRAGLPDRAGCPAALCCLERWWHGSCGPTHHSRRRRPRVDAPEPQPAAELPIPESRLGPTALLAPAAAAHTHSSACDPDGQGASTGPTAHKPTKAASSQRAAERKAAQAPTAQSISPRTPVPPKPAAAPTLPGVVPDQPGQALDLAKAIAGGHQALSAEGASPAQVALQRRQWWLSPRDAGLLQRAWDLAEPAEAPSDWNTLPAGTQLRRVPAQALGALTSGDPRGRSLVNREQITLLWGSGTQLWMLRLTLSD
jgi:hypothetical protein